MGILTISAQSESLSTVYVRFKNADQGPCNILIDANYRSKLCNFGLSNLFLQPGTCPPNLMARLPYMDPEFNTTGELTTLSDVYSLGDWPYIQAKQLALIGLSCTEMTRKKRPDLLTKVWKVVEPLTRKPLAATWPYLQSATGDSCVPSAFICPISLEIMKDPQMASDGFTYEAEAIRSCSSSSRIPDPAYQQQLFGT
uniref:RING-type E3 ubiquitin transferase n=1 Tax=Oryza sativa subsp. japonica TaxID=39947 RepID=Q84ME4_ORYSJ|nr:hypothetical protein Os03g31040 [Oryza sativa Japonica Group]